MSARVQVKVCGLTSAQDALDAALAGADAIGLVFWPRSPRAVDVAAARRICAELPPFVARVGVFVDAPPDELRRVADAVPLDLLQLHGHEPLEALDGLPRRAIKALGAGAGLDLEQARRFAEKALLLLDTGGQAQPGGTGRVFDWSIARSLRARVPRLILAGGLNPENVAAAVQAVRPDAVDVSSGVESSPGRKDAARVRAFIDAVRATAVAPPAWEGGQAQ